MPDPVETLLEIALTAPFYFGQVLVEKITTERFVLWNRDADGAIASTKLPKDKFDPARDQATAANPPGSATPATAAIPATVPLLCQEACSLLIAECRKVVKGE